MSLSMLLLLTQSAADWERVSWSRSVPNNQNDDAPAVASV